MNKRDFLIHLLFLSIIISVGLFVISLEKSFFEDVIFWHNDDTFTLSPAVNLSQGHGFVRNYAPPWGSLPVDELIDRFPDVVWEEGTRGPLNTIFIATFFLLNSSEPSTYFSDSIIANSILYLIFLVTSYFILIRYFPKIVVLSSVLFIALFPLLATLSIKNLSILLSFVFFNFSLFFLKKNTKHYILFGFFSGLVHLTHPFGLIPIISYVIFLISKREIKGTLIVLGISLGLGIPWYLRNFYIFSDPFRGLGTHAITSINIEDQSFSFTFNSFSFFSRMINGNIELVSVTFAFIISLIGIGFLVYLIINRKSISLTNDHLRFYQFVPIFTIILLIGGFFFGIFYGQVPSLRNISFFYIFLIPFGIFSIYSIFKKILEKRITKSYQFLIPVSILLLFLPFMSYLDLIQSNDLLDSYASEFSLNTFENVKTFAWINENIPYDSVIATNQPQIVYTYTTLTSIGIPAFSNILNSYNFVNHYQVDYFVLFEYDRKDQSIKQLINFNHYYIIQDDSVIFFTVAFQDHDPISQVTSVVFKVFLPNSIGDFLKQKEFFCGVKYDDCIEAIIDLEDEAYQFKKIGDDFSSIDDYEKSLEKFTDLMAINPTQSIYIIEKIKLLILLDRADESYNDLHDLFTITNIILKQEKVSWISDHSELTEIANLYKNDDKESFEMYVYYYLLEYDRFNPELLYLLADAHERKGDTMLAIHLLEQIRMDNLPEYLAEKIFNLKQKLPN